MKLIFIEYYLEPVPYYYGEQRFSQKKTYFPINKNDNRTASFIVSISYSNLITRKMAGKGKISICLASSLLVARVSKNDNQLEFIIFNLYDNNNKVILRFFFKKIMYSFSILMEIIVLGSASYRLSPSILRTCTLFSYKRTYPYLIIQLRYVHY